MFLLSNYKKSEPFKITKANNLNVLESSIDNLTFKAIEENTPVQFFCVKSSNDEKVLFKTKDFIEAQYFTIETLFEKPKTENFNPSGGFLNLIHDFGDKKAKEYLEKRSLKRAPISENVSFNIENQFLPQFNKEAKTPQECYSLSLLFDDKIIEAFEGVETPQSDMCLFVRTIYREDQKLFMNILDFLHKLLNEKFISERSLGQYSFYFEHVKNDLVRGRLSPILKDKFIVKFYIAALICCGFELVLDQIPRFGESVTKTMNLLKIIGCSLTKNGRVKLDSMPKESFTAKKFKSK